MSYIEDGGFFSPICKHFIDLEEIRNANWLQCPCGKWYNYSLLVDLESAKGRLEITQDDVRYIEAEVARVSVNGASAGVKRFIKAVMTSFRAAEGGADVSASAPAAAPASPNVRTIEPAVAQSKYTVPVATTTAPAAAASAVETRPVAATPRPAYVPPTPKVPARPAALASSENRRQIGLFITAVTMVMVAFISYLGWGASLPDPIQPEVQVPIASAVVIGLGFVAVRARRLSRQLSNILAITSSVLALVSLWALANYNVWGAKEVWVKGDWNHYPYVALIPLILAALTFYPGYRFKVAAWLNPTVVLVAISGVLFNLTYQQSVFFADTAKLSLGWQLLAPTFTAVLVVVAGRLSRAKLDELPDEKAVEKLVGAPEEERRAYYELVDAHRERTTLNFITRASLIGLLVVMAAHVVGNLLGLAQGRNLDGAGLLVLGVVWTALSIGIETVGGSFTASGNVALGVKRGAWITALGGIGLGASTVTLTSTETFDATNAVIAGIIWLVGALLLFAPRLVSAVRENKSIALASYIAAAASWASWLVYAFANNSLNSAASIGAVSAFALLIGMTLIAHNFIFKSTSLQIPAAAAISFGALLVSGAFRTDNGAASITNNAVAILVTLAILNGFTILNAVINNRADQGDSIVVRSIGIAAQVIGVFTTAPAVLGRLSDQTGAIVDATNYWPLLLVLILFAAALLVIPNLKFATKDDSLLSIRGGQTLIGTSVLYMGAGFVYLITLAKNGHIFETVTGYTFAVMLVVLSYGVIRRAVWAITTSYGLSTVFAIGLGEAMMVYQNVGREGHGDTTVWALWFLVPFAVLTYLHLLLMRLRADASDGYKVGLGVGGFALTSIVFEMTRAANQTNTPFGDGSNADYILNRDVNVATLLGLGALVLLLRLIPAVRKDLARDMVLNFSGLIALALALVDSSTSAPGGSDNLATRLALLVVTAMLLINARTAFAKPQVIAAFFVGQGLIYSFAEWVGHDTDWLKALDPETVAVAGPYLVFLLVLGWFALAFKLGSKAQVSSLFKNIALGITGLIAAIQVGSLSIFDAPNNSYLYAAGTLGLLFAWRWVTKKSQIHFGVMVAGVLVWVGGALSTLGSNNDMAHFSLYGLILVIPAALLLVDSLITRKAVSTIVGVAPLVLSAWFFAGSLIQDAHLFLAIWHLILPAAAFAIATLVLRSIKALETNRYWFTAMAPIAFISGIAEIAGSLTPVPFDHGSDWRRPIENSIDWPANLLLSLFVLALTVRLSKKIASGANVSLLIGSGSIWFTGLLLIGMGDRNEQLGTLTVNYMTYLAFTTIVLFWHSLAAKSRTTLVLATAGSIVSGFMVSEVARQQGVAWSGPEIGSLVSALGVAFAAFAYGKVVGPAKSTLFTWGLPTAAFLWPSVLYTFSSGQLSQAWEHVGTEGIVRLIGLALVGTLVMLLGMRLGNRGLVYASVATLMFEFVPALWFAIDNQFGNYGPSVVTELRGLLIAATLAVLQTILKRVAHIKFNSILVWGVPVVVAMAPTLLDVWGALGHGVEANDWVRFAVLVGVSTGFLIIGAIRRLSGLFYPGFIGVITAVLPYAFVRGGGLWIVAVLVVLAALIIWVAVRIDRFTGWLKELQ